MSQVQQNGQRVLAIEMNPPSGSTLTFSSAYIIKSTGGRSAMIATKPDVTAFYDRSTGSIQYIVADPVTGRCAIIDPVLDFDERSGTISTVSAETLIEYIDREQLTIEWILDTHPHADHFSAVAYLKEKTGVATGIGRHVIDVQRMWSGIYNWPDFVADGSQWDRLFDDGDTFWVGMLPVKVLHSPGHTLASVTYLIGDCAFVHDTLCMPDSGTARCDFPCGSATNLWNSIQKILALPDECRMFVGHDYCPGRRKPRWETTVAEQKAANVHVAKGMTEAGFVAQREERDRALPMPRLMLFALQANICGGQLPAPEANGKRYLKFPLDALPSSPTTAST